MPDLPQPPSSSDSFGSPVAPDSPDLQAAREPQPAARRPAPRPEEPHSGPWWRYRIMWLVVGGPALVVIAGFFTLYLAIANPDYLYTDEQRPPTPGATRHEQAAHAPAMQARNHAATGGMAEERETPVPDNNAPAAPSQPEQEPPRQPAKAPLLIF